jgi:hypothetical protein
LRTKKREPNLSTIARQTVTPEILDVLRVEHPQLVTMRHEKNKGKTEALKTGFGVTRLVVDRNNDR